MSVASFDQAQVAARRSNRLMWLVVIMAALIVLPLATIPLPRWKPAPPVEEMVLVPPAEIQTPPLVVIPPQSNDTEQIARVRKVEQRLMMLEPKLKSISEKLDLIEQEQVRQQGESSADVRRTQ